RLPISNPTKTGLCVGIWLSVNNFICSGFKSTVLSKTACKSMPNFSASLNLSPVAGKSAPKVPANAYPAAFEIKKTPYNKDENLLGESFPTNDNPIGDKQSSPQVWMKYNKINHLIANIPVLPKSFTL